MTNIFELPNGKITDGEIGLVGTAVSRGVGIGSAVLLIGSKRQYLPVEIATESVPDEIARFAGALEISRKDLAALADGEVHEIENAREIFAVQLLILERSEFAANVCKLITDAGVNAEWAVANVTDALVNKFGHGADTDSQEKLLDIHDIAERVLDALCDNDKVVRDLSPDSIVVASFIRPSTLVELARHKPLAIVTEHGGWTSHAFIMARELGIPAVTGVKDANKLVMSGDQILVDGFSGKVVIRPSAATISASRHDPVPDSPRTVADGPAARQATTVDGRKILVRANVEHFGSASDLREFGAVGVGLLRSEYLFGRRDGSFPPEEAQVSAYRAVAENIGTDRVRIRTFDLTLDQLSLGMKNRDPNPALGLRAIRLSFADDHNFRTQVRAILLSHVGNNIDILIPMISGPDEIRRAKTIIDHERSALALCGLDPGDPQIGVMIEIPSAVVLIHEIAAMVDFLCIGTNDLVQYLLAVDRDNESVADWYQTLHPAVIRSIRTVLRAADAMDVPATICGEMGGSSFYTPLLIGLGARDFSMNLNSIAAVRNVIAGISYEECAQVAQLAEACSSANDAEDAIKSFYKEKWPHIFSSLDLDDVAQEGSAASSEK